MLRLATFTLLLLACALTVRAEDRLIGLLEIPSLHKGINEEGNPELTPAPLTLLRGPYSASEPVVVARTWREIEYNEHSYEVVSANVYERDTSGGLWYKLKFKDDGKTILGWVKHADGMQYRDIHSLIDRGMSYLTNAWDRRLKTAPSPEAPFKIVDSKPNPTAARIVEIHHSQSDSQVWYLIAITSAYCTDEPPEILATGWVPAYAPSGATNMWYFSRGC